MNRDERNACLKLWEGARLVSFDLLEEVFTPTAPPDEDSLRLQLQLKDHDHYPANQDDRPPVEWGAFAVIFFLASCSFADARPTPHTGNGYKPQDLFGVADFHQYLGFVDGNLHFNACIIRGRRMATMIVVQPNGRMTLETTGRGRQALDWLEEMSLDEDT